MECLNCTSYFKAKREWQVFCCNSCKTTYNRENKEYCFYCGEHGNHRDHIHPVSVRGSQRKFLGQETVHACAECNQTLSNNLFDDISERVEFIIKSYEKSYADVLKCPAWTEEELEELGRDLRNSIKKSFVKRRIIEERLKYLFNVKLKMKSLLSKELEYTN